MRSARIALFLAILFIPFLTNAQEVEQVEPPDSEVRHHYQSGNSYLEQGKYDLAIEEYKQAISIQPWFPDAHMKLGLAFYCRGLFQLAATELENGIRLTARGRPKDSWPFATMRLLSLVRAGEHEEARRLLEQWSNAGGHLERDVRYLSGRWNEKKYLSKRKKEPSHGYLVIGVNRLTNGDLEEAERMLHLVTDERAKRLFGWSRGVAEAELERIERCGPQPCGRQGVGEEWMFRVEEGKPEELRDVQSVYVSQESAHRENILKNLKKHQGITILSAIEDETPDAILVLESETSSSDTWIFTGKGGAGYPAEVREVRGRGLALKLIEGNTIRVLWRFEDAQNSVFFWERHPSTNFARDFLKLLNKPNKEKAGSSKQH